MRYIFIIFFSISFCLSSQAKIIITEIMQSNIDCVMDDMNEFPDSWIELYNTETTPEDASKYSIGESSDPSKAWRLPSKTFSPKRYQLIYCDKEAKDFHTDFRLDVDEKVSVYLFKDNVIVDSIIISHEMPSQNISYGRLTKDSDVWGNQETPTPNNDNCNSICNEILGEPIFSEEGGVFTSSNKISLSISLPNNSPSETVIRYTTDGSEPTQFSTLYSSPITINSTLCVRAKLFKKGYLSPRSTTHSYIFLNRDMTLPVISINTNNDFFYNNLKGIYVDGNYSTQKKNYQYDWRRPINIEMFDKPNAASVINQMCETRISGAASRGCKFKSLALYSNKRFGKKKFKYEFFPDQRPGQKNFKSLVLRNAGNDFDYLYMRDAIAQRTFATYTDIDYQAWRPAIIYINGTYKGILNIRERGNGNNIYTNYDELEDIDVVENWNSIKEGDNINLKAFKEFYNEHNHTLEEYSHWMDIDEFINFWIMNCYFNNIDFPANNFMMWRPKTEDGKWRFIAKDVDYILGIYSNAQPYNYKYLNWLVNNNFDPNAKWANTSDGTRLYRRLLEDEDFKRTFIDRFCIYMGDFLNYNKIWQNIWEPMYNTIHTEYPNHRKLINQWWPNYNDELSTAQSWLKQRTNFMYQHLSDYFNLGKPVELSINQSIDPNKKENINLSINGIEISTPTLNGKTFPSTDITLTPAPKEDALYEVNGWDITEISNSGSVKTTHIDEAEYTFTIPSCSRLIINATFGTFNSINTLELANENTITNNTNTYNSSPNSEPSIYNVKGIRTSKLTKGINIIKTSDGNTKKVIY